MDFTSNPEKSVRKIGGRFLESLPEILDEALLLGAFHQALRR